MNAVVVAASPSPDAGSAAATPPAATPSVAARLGFLVSGRGSNLRALLQACRQGTLPATPAVVIADRAQAPALALARQAGLPALHLGRHTHTAADALDAAVRDALLHHRVDWVVLAGYLRKVGAVLLAAFRGRIVNIHPGPLPEFGGHGMYGLHVHRAVLAAGRSHTAVTIHLVDEEYDRGPVLAARPVPVLADDSAETLAARVLAEEHRFYALTLAKLLRGELSYPHEQREA